MRGKKRFCSAIALLLALLLAFAACGKPKPGSDAPDPSLPEDVAENGTEAFEALMEEFSALADIDDTAYVRTANSAAALNKVLAAGKSGAVRLKTADADLISVPAGDYAGSTVALNAPNAGAVLEGEMDCVIAEALGAEGLTLNGGVKSLVVTGADIPVTLNGGAGRIYIQGKSCTLRLAGGSFGEIVCVNSIVKIENGTQTDVTVYMANGAPQTLKAGETLQYGFSE